MIAIKGTWKNGQIVLDSPPEWPEGRRLIVAEEPLAQIHFLTEEEQRDDPESVQRWIDDLRATPPLPMTPEQEAEIQTWSQKVREFNLEAVRKQMAEGIL